MAVNLFSKWAWNQIKSGEFNKIRKGKLRLYSAQKKHITILLIEVGISTSTREKSK